jgi:hypothetical protein
MGGHMREHTGHPIPRPEDPCVGGSIPPLATNKQRLARPQGGKPFLLVQFLCNRFGLTLANKAIRGVSLMLDITLSHHRRTVVSE